MPARAIREREKKDSRPYGSWVKAGWIEAIDGPVIDARVVLRRILQLAAIFDIEEIAYDKFRANVIAAELADEGLTTVEFGQTPGWFNEPTRALLTLILERRLLHETNPVSRFCADCLAVRRDADERLKPVKPDREKSGKRIDGIVARIMALDRALRHGSQKKTSIYEDPDFLRMMNL